MSSLSLFSPLNLLVFIVMISILVAIHELGHYLVARLFKMGVHEFAIGFGRPVLWVWARRKYKVGPNPEDVEETEFTIRPFPFGGFVRIKGMQPEDDGSEVNIPGGFFSKPPLHRFLALLAGPLFSVIAGVLIIATVMTVLGAEEPINKPTIGFIGPTGALAKAGIKEGDRVLSVEGAQVSTFYDIVANVRSQAGKSLTFVYERDGQRYEAEVVPELESATSPVLGPDLNPTGELKQQAKLGASPPTEKIPIGFGEAVVKASLLPYIAAKGLVDLALKPQTFKDNVGGPLTMLSATESSVKSGIDSVIMLSGLLSVSVGIFNLLPIYPLDGGQMLVAFAEMLRGGRRLSMKIQNRIATAGFLVVMMLTLSVWFVDIRRHFVERPEQAKKALESRKAAEEARQKQDEK